MNPPRGRFQPPSSLNSRPSKSETPHLSLFKICSFGAVEKSFDSGQVCFGTINPDLKDQLILANSMIPNFCKISETWTIALLPAGLTFVILSPACWCPPVGVPKWPGLQMASLASTWVSRTQRFVQNRLVSISTTLRVYQILSEDFEKQKNKTPRYEVSEAEA